MALQKKKIINHLILPESTVKIDFVSEKKKNLLSVHFIPSVQDAKNSKKGAKKKVSDRKTLNKKYPSLNSYSFFEGKLKEIVHTPQEIFVGIGKLEELSIDNFSDIVRELFQRIVFQLQEVQFEITEELIQKIQIHNMGNIMATALGMNIYPTDILKSKPSKEKLTLKKITFSLGKITLAEFKKSFLHYKLLSNHINAMRQIQSLPGNYFTPEAAAERAKNVAAEFNLKINILNEKDLKKIGAGGILAVSRGSATDAKLIVLEYNPRGNAKKKIPTLALIGKGVTFDTGGISIKPSGDMHEMKYDMSGAAAVMHSVSAIAELKLPVRVVGVMGMVENMPGSMAFKPGDVYTSLKGLTIEVQNTDAEGRLVLGDLLYYAEKNYKPDLIINLATLTGACVVALGYFYAGLFTLKDNVRDFMLDASEKSIEPIWPLPIGERYKNMLKSDIADHNNIGGRGGGASSAASFLSLFVKKETNWAHLDIAGIGFIKSSFQLYPKVATGFGIRLLSEIANKMSKNIKDLTK